MRIGVTVKTSRHALVPLNMPDAHSSGKAKDRWRKWVEHWETQEAIASEKYNIPQCGLFGCDEKVKTRDGKWRCVACGKISGVGGEL